MKNGHILIVEDSRTQAEALRDLLERERYHVEVASSAEAALDHLAKATELPEVVLSDIVMPGLSGYDLTRRIKADKRFDEMPVVLLTSLSNPLDIVRGLECGADNYVTKPYDPEYLIARLRHVLGQKRLRRGLRASLGVNVNFLGTTFTITSDREQILDLFLSSVEDVVRTNQALEQSQQELAEAQRQLEAYAHTMAQRALTSTERLRTVMEASPIAIIALDLDRNVTVWNPAAERIFGYRAEEALGQPVKIVPQDRQAESDRFLQALESGAYHRLETQRVTKDGRTIDVVISVAPLGDPQGELEGFVANVEDVTEQKRTAAALEASQAQLIQAQKMEAIGTLAGGIAHDFNNLLTVMRSYSGMLVEELPPGDHDNRQAASEILAAADRAAGLTRQLLSFSRKQVLQPRLVAVDEVVRGFHQLLRRLLPANIELTLRLDAGDAVVRIDPGQLEQVLMNLVINASHAMPGGGGVEVSTRTVMITGSEKTVAGPLTAGPHLSLLVTDTGTGMTEETLARLFEPFFTTKAAGTGTGLGMSIVRKIVTDQRGAMDVRTGLGRGTTFEIFLPLAAEPGGAPQAAPTAVAQGREVILVVDSDKDVCAGVRIALERFGYTVLEAQDGGQALGVAGMLSSAPDLLIMDSAQERGADELASQLARSGRKPKVLLMADEANVGAIDEKKSAGRAVIRKPFSRETLSRKVRAVLDSH